MDYNVYYVVTNYYDSEKAIIRYIVFNDGRVFEFTGSYGILHTVYNISIDDVYKLHSNVDIVPGNNPYKKQLFYSIFNLDNSLCYLYCHRETDIMLCGRDIDTFVNKIIHSTIDNELFDSYKKYLNIS